MTQQTLVQEPINLEEIMDKEGKPLLPIIQPEEVPTEQPIAVKEIEPVVQPEPRRGITLIETKPTEVMNPQAYIQVKAIATDYFNGGILPKGIASPMTALYIIQAGMEMGLKPIESIQSLYPVNGNLNFWGKAVVNRLRVHGWSIKYYDEKENTVSVEVANGVEKYNETLTFAECEQSGYTKSSYGLKPGWLPGLNRKKKLRYNVLQLVINTYIPEVLGNAGGIVEVTEDFGNDSVIETVPEDNKPATENQKELILNLAKKQGVEVDVENMTNSQAINTMRELSSKKSK